MRREEKIRNAISLLEKVTGKKVKLVENNGEELSDWKVFRAMIKSIASEFGLEIHLLERGRHNAKNIEDQRHTAQLDYAGGYLDIILYPMDGNIAVLIKGRTVLDQAYDQTSVQQVRDAVALAVGG